MPAQIIQQSEKVISEIIQRLQDGEVVILPSDTTYALVVNGRDDRAMRKVMELKGWNVPQPLAIFTRKEKANEVAILNGAAKQMMEHFPYPVTMVVPKQETVSDMITGGYPNILVTCPDAFIYDLIQAVPFPMACASAKMGDFVGNSAKAAMQLFGDRVSLIVDGGKSKYGRSGTMVDFTVSVPTILKYGPVSVDDLRLILPDVELPSHLRK